MIVACDLPMMLVQFFEVLSTHLHVTVPFSSPRWTIWFHETAESSSFLQEMEARNHPWARFTWRFSNSSCLQSGGSIWKIVVLQEGDDADGYLGMSLKVDNHGSLPVGWSGDMKFTEHNFHSGSLSFMPIADLHDPTRGYLVQDTLAVEASVVVLDVVPPVADPDAVPTDRFLSYFSSLDKFIGAEPAAPGLGEGPRSGTQYSSRTVPTCPTSEEVANAKQSLKECLSDLFKGNMKERLASALSTLSAAETGLSPGQRKSVLDFFVHFDDFISDYITFEQSNTDYELQKLQSELLFSTTKRNREKHLAYKVLPEKLAVEEEKLKKKMEDTRCRNAKLISDWEALIAKPEGTKSEYVSRKPKLAEAEERKRIAEERMSRSTTAWSSLKAQFL